VLSVRLGLLVLLVLVTLLVILVLLVVVVVDGSGCQPRGVDVRPRVL
jgi:hypothetical protein